MYCDVHLFDVIMGLGWSCSLSSSKLNTARLPFLLVICVLGLVEISYDESPVMDFSDFISLHLKCVQKPFKWRLCLEKQTFDFWS